MAKPAVLEIDKYTIMNALTSAASTCRDAAELEAGTRAAFLESAARYQKAHDDIADYDGDYITLT